MKIIPGTGTPVHPDISALIPWYVNGSIGDRERRRVDAHLAQCAHCRDELAREQWVYRQMTAKTAVEHMPADSLNRLQARLDGIGGIGVAQPAHTARRSMPWPGVMAASVAVMALALSLLAADRWLQYRAARAAAPPAYYTVTTAAARAPDEAIRAVFSPTITLSELQGILEEAQLRIVSGPSEAGVYSLAPKSREPVNSSLALLRSHPQVRFAESTASAPIGPPATP
ncbi:MAG: anti-sigma factor [Steroidobacteraceae bacterium]